MSVFPRKTFFCSLYKSTFRKDAGSEFLNSLSSRYVNPRSHVHSSDTVLENFNADRLAGMDDRKVLSLLTLGFFGGFIFGPESMLLRAGAWNLLPVNFTTFPNTPQAPSIWKSSDIPQHNLCPVGTRLFGTFQLLDWHISESSTCGSSYVDYGFGSDEYSFAGCHRLRITRLQSPAEKKEPQIQLSLEGFHCNPQRNTLSMPEIGKWFHTFYARALFANGVQSVLDGGSAA